MLSAPYYTCISGDASSRLLLSLDVTSDAVQLISRPLSEYVSLQSSYGSLSHLDGNSIIPGFTIDNRKIVVIKNNQLELLKVDVVDPSASVSVIESVNGPLVLQAWSDNVSILLVFLPPDLHV